MIIIIIGFCTLESPIHIKKQVISSRSVDELILKTWLCGRFKPSGLSSWFFCSVRVTRGRRPQEQETTTATTFSFVAKGTRRLNHWSKICLLHTRYHRKGPFSFLHFAGLIFLPGGFFLDLIVDWKSCIYLNYHLLFECALTPPGPLQARFIIACGGI